LCKKRRDRLLNSSWKRSVAKGIRATSSSGFEALFVSRETESDLSRTSSGVVSPRNGVNILATRGWRGGWGREKFRVMPSAYPFPSFPPRNTSAEGLKRGARRTRTPCPLSSPGFSSPLAPVGGKWLRNSVGELSPGEWGRIHFTAVFVTNVTRGASTRGSTSCEKNKVPFPAASFFSFTLTRSRTSCKRRRWVAPSSPLFSPSPPFPLLLSRAYTLGYLRIRYGRLRRNFNPRDTFLTLFRDLIPLTQYFTFSSRYYDAERAQHTRFAKLIKFMIRNIFFIFLLRRRKKIQYSICICISSCTRYIHESF